MVTPAPDHGRLRASHADREHVVEALKTAFVQGRLTQDELDARVGQALAARTYADLAALTADLSAVPDRTPAAPPVPAVPPVPAAPPAQRPRNQAANRAVKVGACVVAGSIGVISGGAALATGQPVAAVVLAVIMVLLTAGATAVVAALIATVLKVESRRQNRSRGQLPPRPTSGAGGQAAPSPPAAGRVRKVRRRPDGSLAVGRAG